MRADHPSASRRREKDMSMLVCRMFSTEQQHMQEVGSTIPPWQVALEFTLILSYPGVTASLMPANGAVAAVEEML